MMGIFGKIVGRFRGFLSDVRASVEQKVIGLAIAVFIASAILPTAIGNWFGANTTGWSTEAQTMWSVGGLLIVVAIVIAFYGYAKGRR